MVYFWPNTFMEKENIKLGFVGQGYVGKNYADDFEKRGYSLVRYSLEEPFINNKEAIRDCNIVFIAVPTPTTPKGFDSSIVEKSLSLLGDGTLPLQYSSLLNFSAKPLQLKTLLIRTQT